MQEIDRPAREAAIRHLIAERAYQLWESHGRPQGYDQIHWRQAEQEIMTCIDQVSSRTGARSPEPPPLLKTREPPRD